MANERNYTARVTIDALTDPDAINIPSDWQFVRKILLYEETGTINWTFRAPLKASAAAGISMGQQLRLEGGYKAGDTVGYGSVSSSSATIILIGEQ